MLGKNYHDSHNALTHIQKYLPNIWRIHCFRSNSASEEGVIHETEYDDDDDDDTNDNNYGFM